MNTKMPKVHLLTAIGVLLVGTAGCSHARTNNSSQGQDPSVSHDQQMRDAEPSPGAPKVKPVITTKRDETRERGPASTGELRDFDGTYQLTSGKKKKCAPSLTVSVEGEGDGAQVHIKQESDDYALNLDSGQQPAQFEAGDRCPHFTEDQLTDNNDRANALGRTIAESGPRWEIRRSYSRKCKAEGPTTFVGFKVWEFSPHSTETGKPAVTFHSIFGPEFRCEYQKSAAGA